MRLAIELPVRAGLPCIEIQLVPFATQGSVCQQEGHGNLEWLEWGKTKSLRCLAPRVDGNTDSEMRGPVGEGSENRLAVSRQKPSPSFSHLKPGVNHQSHT